MGKTRRDQINGRKKGRKKAKGDGKKRCDLCGTRCRPKVLSRGRCPICVDLYGG